MAVYSNLRSDYLNDLALSFELNNNYTLTLDSILEYISNMSVVKVPVPIERNDNEMSHFLCNVSQHIDAGNDVEFVNANDTTKDINVSMIHLDTNGTVCIWGVGETISDAQTITLLGGSFHTIPGIHGIRAVGTGIGLGIKVKI